MVRWSEEAGCTGMLVYTDNGLVRPVAAWRRRSSRRRSGSPAGRRAAGLHAPYTVAKLVASSRHLHGRAVHLNIVAGGFRNDLLALGDETAHDDRYDRLVEYTADHPGLLADDGPVTLPASATAPGATSA